MLFLFFLPDHEGDSLYEIIDGDKRINHFDLDLSKEAFDAIEPKLTVKEVQGNLIKAFKEVFKEIFSENQI